MAATFKRQMWYHKGPLPKVVEYPIAASQGTFPAGHPCYISTSGTVKLSDTSDGTGDAWHGFLVEAVSTELAANVKVPVAMIEKGQWWRCYVETSGTDAAAPQTIVGDSLGLTVSTTSTEEGYTTLDTANSNTTVIVRDVIWNIEDEKHASTDSPGQALVEFLTANIEASRA